MDWHPVLLIFSLFFGLALGSFVNVCIYRIPQKMSIVSPPSSCPQCGHKIRFYDNIPLLSYLCLGGKCRHCRTRIPLHYPIVEAVSALFSLGLFIRFGPSYQYILFLLFVLSLTTISVIDLQHQIIPDIISLPGILAGLGSSFILHHITWVDSLIGVLGGGGILFLIAMCYRGITGKEGLGGGDVKLFAMIGGWLGWKALPFVLLISSISGTVIGIVTLWLRRQGFRTRLPFGPFLSFGAVCYLFFGLQLVLLYYRLVF